MTTSPENKRLLMYSRTFGCPYISVAKRVFDQYNISYDEVYIDQDTTARQRVLDWTGFLSVPTIIITKLDDDLPYEPPAHLPQGESPRGINRGSMITEANQAELIEWLHQHGFID